MRATHRYLAVIVPSAPVSEAVVRMREALHARIGHFTGRGLMPHITLFLADVPEELGGRIAEGIGRGVHGAAPFGLHYAGITHFPDRRTIYIDPVEKDAVASVRGVVVEGVRVHALLSDHVRTTEHPHLTIAAGLKPAQFDVAWAMLAPHAFTGVQHVDGVLLLRRELKAGAVYTPVQAYAFPRAL